MNYLIFQERSSQQYYRLDIYQREFSSEQLLQATQRLPLFSDFKVENTDDEKDDKGKRKKIRGKKICDEQRRVRKKEKAYESSELSNLNGCIFAISGFTDLEPDSYHCYTSNYITFT